MTRLSIIKDEILFCMNSCQIIKDNKSSMSGLNSLGYFEDKESDTQFFTGKWQDTFIIGFKGTGSFKDIKTDLYFFKKQIPYENKNTSIRVHSGFINAYKSKGVRNLIHDMIKGINLNRILITGNSLGGALCTLCAVDIQYNFPAKEIKCIALSSPRVGNWAFAKSYNKRVPNTIRIVNGNDIVTRLPFWFVGFKHVKNLLHIGSKFWIPCGSIKDHFPKNYIKAIEEMKDV